MWVEHALGFHFLIFKWWNLLGKNYVQQLFLAIYFSNECLPRIPSSILMKYYHSSLRNNYRGAYEISRD